MKQSRIFALIAIVAGLQLFVGLFDILRQSVCGSQSLIQNLPAIARDFFELVTIGNPVTIPLTTIVLVWWIATRGLRA